MGNGDNSDREGGTRLLAVRSASSVAPGIGMAPKRLVDVLADDNDFGKNFDSAVPTCTAERPAFRCTVQHGALLHHALHFVCAQY